MILKDICTVVCCVVEQEKHEIFDEIEHFQIFKGSSYTARLLQILYCAFPFIGAQ